MSIGLFDAANGYAVFSQSDYQTGKHAHYAIEIVSCAGGTFCVTTDQAEYTDLTNIIIPSNIPHSFHCGAATCDLVFLDPLSAMGRAVARQYNLASGVLINVPGLTAQLPGYKINTPDLSATLQLDHRIETCIQKISSSLADGDLSLARLSGTAFLSEGRLAHLFKAQTGISIRQYILWKKVLLAIQRCRQGHSITDSAHHAGFSDSSHFHRAFYKMFGIKPFFVLKN